VYENVTRVSLFDFVELFIFNEYDLEREEKGKLNEKEKKQASKQANRKTNKQTNKQTNKKKKKKITLENSRRALFQLLPER